MISVPEDDTPSRPVLLTPHPFSVLGTKQPSFLGTILLLWHITTYWQEQMIVLNLLWKLRIHFWSLKQDCFLQIMKQGILLYCSHSFL